MSSLEGLPKLWNKVFLNKNVRGCKRIDDNLVCAPEGTAGKKRQLTLPDLGTGTHPLEKVGRRM
eukprot:7431805-Prorocentrum_lima.AAC.1